MAVNWPGLLAWSTKYHDGTAPSQFKQMSDEDRAFLEKAMEEAFGQIEDPNQVLQECVVKIMAEDRTDESIMTSLEVIDRLCDDPDVARNIEKLKGMQPLLDLARDKGDAIRTRTLEILALLFSNNPNIQDAGAKRGAMDLFLNLTRSAPACSEERSKAFRALVALVRLIRPLEEQFLREKGGLELLVALLSPAEDVRTREKVASFASSGATNGILQEAEAVALAGAVAALLPTAGEGGIQYREVLSGCASELAKVAPKSMPEALGTSAAERLKLVRSGAKEDGDNGAEEGALQETLATLGVAA